MAVVKREAENHTGGKYARGLAYEGWSGGYLAALRDVLLLLDGVKPNTRNYWESEKERKEPAS